MLQEAQRYIEIETKEKTRARVEQQLKQDKEDMNYKKSTTISEINSRASVGDLDISEARDQASNVEYAIKGTVAKGRSLEASGHLYDIQDDGFDKDENREQYLERTAEDPSYEPGYGTEVAYTTKEEERDMEERREDHKEVLEKIYEDWDEWEEEYIEEELEEELDDEEVYYAWNQTPPDRERFHEYK
jgi:hypothetical protein